MKTVTQDALDTMDRAIEEITTLRAKVSSLTAEVAVLVGALTRISKSRLLDMDTLHPDACPSLAAETLANIPEATKAMGEVIEAARALKNGIAAFDDDRDLVLELNEKLTDDLSRLHAGRGA